MRRYIAIDLKSFYASVECMERGLDPLETNLIVADKSRSSKTICLAVSPSMKKYGLPGRCRLFEAEQKIREVNSKRLLQTKERKFSGKSHFSKELESNPNLELDCIIAPPQMAKYIQISTEIYKTYLDFVSEEDIHVYSIDEVFIDATPYLNLYKMTAHELALKMIKSVLKKTGITATAGIGTNLFLAKIAMDIEAKHMRADSDGVRIAELDEMSYREKLWNHTPLTDFWRIGKGIAARLKKYGIHTMGDIARISQAGPNCAINEETLYKEFGVNAELLIDHAWGWEDCTMQDIKNYKPKNSSLSTGQVLTSPYNFEKSKIVVREMAESLSLDLVKKELLTFQISLFIGYEALPRNLDYNDYKHLELVEDNYGRLTPKPVHAGINFKKPTSSTKILAEAASYIFENIADKKLEVRRLNICAGFVVDEKEYNGSIHYRQQELFSNEEDINKKFKSLTEKEKKLQDAVLTMKNKFGKNAVLKAMNLQDGAMQITRNRQIGGHKA